MKQSGEFGRYDFGLSEGQEARARRLHEESIIIDTLFQGPCGARSFTEKMVSQLQRDYEHHRNPRKAVLAAWKMPVQLAMKGAFPDFKACWDASGVTAGNRQIVGMTTEENGDPFLEAVEWFAFTQAQFDRLPWLVKALRAEDIRRAKVEGKHAGFISSQNSVDIGLNLSRLNQYQDLGMRMIQLTNNSVNYVGGGCTDRVDCGVTDFGVKFIKRMNELGMIIDVSHCGRQTTLDACAISSAPVVASHTGAASVYRHARNKSDEEINAIAATGGHVGVYCLAMFLTNEPVATIECFFDHVGHIAKLVGSQHVGVGTDWPLQCPEWAMEHLFKWMAEIGFRPEHGLTMSRNLVGFDGYQDTPNMARGLVARGYSDEEVKGILGGNFLRVFEQVCG